VVAEVMKITGGKGADVAFECTSVNKVLDTLVAAIAPGGVLVISPEGEHLGTIMTGRPTSNCAFSGDGKTLYITADDLLLRISLTGRS